MKIIAHRGYSARFPENSLAAFERAIDAGADYIETDVRRTRDGILVCWHDPDFKRVAGVDAEIAARTGAELAAIALPGDASLCRLDAVLAMARMRVRVMLDVKIDDDAGRAAIIEAVSTAGMREQIVYGVRSASHARALVAARAPFARLAMPSKPEMLDDFPGERLLGVRLWEDQVDTAAIARIRARGVEVWVTAGVRTHGEAPGYVTQARLEGLRALEVDAVLVNDVGLAVPIARQAERR